MTTNERATTMAIIMTLTARRLATARRALLAGSAVAGVLAATGCSLDSILKNDELPPNVTDPAITKTREGAIAAYNGLVHEFGMAFGGDGSQSLSSHISFSGLLADELSQGSSSAGRDTLPVDARSMPEGVADGLVLEAFGDLQRVRGQAAQAIGLLTRYAPDDVAITGHAYALQALAEIFLAETFCSGIPLSTLDFDGDFTPAPGSPTDDVYAHALALLDTALTMVGDSVRFVHLARMAQARAHLALGELDEAAAAVAEIPVDWAYSISYLPGNSSTSRNFAFVSHMATSWNLTVPNSEGGNGLDYVSSGDPRAATTFLRRTSYNVDLRHPSKYRLPIAAGAPTLDTLAAMNGSLPILLASGVEARLIEAEADLAAGGSAWLAILNALRTDGAVVSTYTREDRRGISSGAGAPQTGSPGPAGVIDTTWGPGTGSWIIPSLVMADAGPVCPAGPSPGVVCTDTVWYKGLGPLEDPGTPDARLDLLFRERAFWLFLTGHRQADLRRLVRRYGRSDVDLYPVGEYPSQTGLSYGNDLNAPVPVEERASNPNFTGCIHRGA